MAKDNYKEASILLSEIIKKYLKKNSSEMKEKKIDLKILPVYYIIGECYIKMNKI